MHVTETIIQPDTNPERPRRRRTAAARKLFLIALAALVAGCATTPDGRVDIRIEPDGSVNVEGRQVALDDLAASVKRTGAKVDTVIEVTVPDDVKSDVLMGVTRPLATAGYKRVVFRKPKQAKATAGATR